MKRSFARARNVGGGKIPRPPRLRERRGDERRLGRDEALEGSVEYARLRKDVGLDGDGEGREGWERRHGVASGCSSARVRRQITRESQSRTSTAGRKFVPGSGGPMETNVRPHGLSGCGTWSASPTSAHTAARMGAHPGPHAPAARSARRCRTRVGHRLAFLRAWSSKSRPARRMQRSRRAQVAGALGGMPVYRGAPRCAEAWPTTAGVSANAVRDRLARV